ncbi:MlaD family protein [Entomobacter blattae]|uniref:MlaD protein n=1 Tax=Entomobacter blattae TaxID=2762277 RepID=A0A7H1NSZ7_9PROT|nr:MlaD family protein [Entomobacter blattae]QNT78907.1 MlaD protein [Entomobacter blattae]
MAQAHSKSAIAFSSLVILVAGLFCFYAKTSQVKVHGDLYPLHARFVSANGLKPHDAVLIGGVTVGMVDQITLDKNSYMADVILFINKSLKIPDDSRFDIDSATMTSDYGVFIRPGTSTKMLSENATVTNTRDAASLEQQISNYIFGNGGLPEDN